MVHIYDTPMVLSSALTLKMIDELKVKDGIDQMRLQILAIEIENMYAKNVGLTVERVEVTVGYCGVVYDIPQCTKEYVQSLIDWIHHNTKENKM